MLNHLIPVGQTQERITRKKGTGKDEKIVQNSVRKLQLIDNLEDARVILYNLFRTVGWIN
jgi:hypothetical protein